ncbi:GNAT family N-acetyltransferase [Leptolyngbya sp. 15MV]|nr:GNAT family N-acetyltransferase [Leptolyngbya sp. 15MV]
MSTMLGLLVAAGKRTSRADEAFVLERYINDPERISCFVAMDEDDKLLGFQSLKCASEGNPYNTPVGWGIIGTHVSPFAARKGIGTKLFVATREAGHGAGLEKIEAYISAQNIEAQAYYEKLGFRTNRVEEGAVCKCYEYKE